MNDHVKYHFSKEFLCYDLCAGVCGIQVGCCSPTRYNACSMYQHTQDLALNIPTWTVVLVLVPVNKSTHACVL